MPSRTPGPYLSLCSGVFIVGFSAIFIRQSAEAPATIIAFYRLAIGMAVMTVPYLLYMWKRKEYLPRRGIWLGLLAGVLFAFDIAVWATGVLLSGATMPTLMANTAPLWVALGGLLIFRETQTGIFWIGLLVAIAGAVIVMREDLLNSSQFGLGTFLGLVAAILYAGFYLVTQKGRKLLSTLSYFWITTTGATFTLLILNLVLQKPFTGYSAFTYFNFLMLGVIVQALGWILLNYVQGHLPASVVSPSLLGQPVITAFLAWQFLGEVFTIWHIIGGIFVLIGIYVVHQSQHQLKPETVKC